MGTKLSHINAELRALLEKDAEIQRALQRAEAGESFEAPETAESGLDSTRMDQITRAAVERVRELKEHGSTWLRGAQTLLAKLASCPPRTPQFAVLSGAADVTDATRVIPLPDDVRDLLPWVEDLVIERTGEESGTARYVARAVPREFNADAPRTAGALSLTLVAADGRQKEVILTAVQPSVRFGEDMPADWDALDVEVRPIAGVVDAE